MKSPFLKPLVTLLILAFTFGCSVDTEESIEQATIEETQLIVSLPSFEETLTPIQITYKSNLTHAEVNAIRATFTNDGFINLMDVDYCSNSNHEVEIWYANIQFCDDCKPARDPKGEIESNGGVNKARLGVDSCILVVE
ncbi:hypothetical protein [uncultured Dokdonia sp.]|uniref:hypothetical protein n=1 Tax=uncultured Dokdonia sp. TaxID=575653 RepID=UPI0026155FF2|nr:hypothetical protein [uncultured Dokdonia sp.]